MAQLIERGLESLWAPQPLRFEFRIHKSAGQHYVGTLETILYPCWSIKSPVALSAGQLLTYRVVAGTMGEYLGTAKVLNSLPVQNEFVVHIQVINITAKRAKPLNEILEKRSRDVQAIFHKMNGNQLPYFPILGPLTVGVQSPSAQMSLVISEALPKMFLRRPLHLKAKPGHKVNLDRIDLLIIDEDEAFLSYVRHHSRHPHIPVLFLKNFQTLDDVARLVNLKADYVIAKPFNDKYFFQIFSEFLNPKGPLEYSQSLKYAINQLEKKDEETALEILYQALTLDDSTPAEAHFLMGSIQLKKRAFGKALNHFSMALDFLPHHLRSLMGAAYAYHEIGAKKQLKNTLEKILEIHPSHLTSLHQALPLASELKDFEWSLKLVNSLLVHVHTHPELNRILECFAISALSQGPRNQRAYKKGLLKVIPQLIEGAHHKKAMGVHLVQFLFDFHFDTEALLLATRIRAQFGAVPDLDFEECIYLLRRKKYEFCLRKALKSYQIFPENIEFLEILATCYEKIKNYELLELTLDELHSKAS